MRVRNGMKSIKEREYLVDRRVERRTTLKGVSKNESIRIMPGFIWQRTLSIGGIL
jgi:hypothetical protein